MTGNQIRQAFLEYFAGKNHTIVKSSSLIPANDPTLYFTNAGMVQFKNVFTGNEIRGYSRATSSQKCMRVSGKHNDLENVGRTARHHTFFEMLGNFSFGDYFKTEACFFGWEFLTKTMGLPPNKLWVTVFENDDEAAAIWEKTVGVPKNRIVRLGAKDNFWSMGETGPCGPCSEIIFEQDIPCGLGNPQCGLGTCDCDKFLEIWNLVFMQFEKHPDGSTTPLPKPSIDTGMGLERLTALLQKKTSNYDCDLFSPIIESIENVVDKKYLHSLDGNHDVSIRVLADHIRSSVFLVSDGVLPSNEGRGYVLRRIMRRAIRHGKLLGCTEPFFYKLVDVVIREMGEAYPELKANQETITRVIHAEEERFFTTLEKGLGLLEEEIASSKKARASVLSGDVAFKLYDTFGFPLDLTELIAAENQLSIDLAGFEQAMTEQRERARAGWKGSGETGLNELHLKLAHRFSTRFLGYDTLESPATVLALIQNGQEVALVQQGKFECICDQTPFYATSGGQVGDHGQLSSPHGHALVFDTQKPSGTLWVHQAELTSGQLKTGQQITLTVQKPLRRAIMRNHTATHLMHAALRKVLGTHVRQAGSFVDDKVLRFDFSHFEAISPETLNQIETMVNEVILADLVVTKQQLAYEEAIAKGALAFFGDKYADQVRMIAIDDYSTELCGGTHVDRTSEIGTFRILSEGSVAAGVRRVEAVTGLNAIHLFQNNAALLSQLCDSLKAQPHELTDRVDKLKAKIKIQDKELEKLKQQLLSGHSQDLMKNTLTINGVQIVFSETDASQDLRTMATTLRDKIGSSGIAIVSAQDEAKAVVVIAVTKDLQPKYPANKMLEPIAKLLGGRGGGKPDMAQGGGPNVASLAEMPDLVKSLLEKTE